MAIAPVFESLLSHPAPGLRFPAHDRAGVDGYILPAPHRVGEPADAAALEVLRRMTEGAAPVQTELLEFYRRWNGAHLCCLPEAPGQEEYTPGLIISPIEDWESTTDDLASGDSSWMVEDLRDMYAPGNFITIGGNASEGTRLVLFVKGQLDGEPLAGRIFCVAMDPVMGYTEVLAESFGAMLKAFAEDPAAFLKKIGFCHTVGDGKGSMFGAVADEYITDTRGMQVLDAPPGM